MSDKISDKLIGYRVKAAREAKGWTQDQLASGLGLKDRQSISDIENAKRILKSEELMTLSDLLDQEIEFFIDPFAVAGEARFSWRANISPESLGQFELQAGRWIGLLRFLREHQTNRASVLKRSLRLSALSSYEDAQKCAETLVEELDLGLVPAETLITTIEQQLDIPVLFVDTINNNDNQSISGATIHLNEFGALLINRNETEARRNFDLAHELFHALTWDRMEPEHCESNSIEESSKGKRVEQLANNFAAALLMPSASLNKLIDSHRLENITHLCEVASRFHVAPTSLAWRLYNLKLISLDTKAQLSALKQNSTQSDRPKLFSATFVKMLHEALENGKLSVRKAAKALGVGLGGLADIFIEYNLSAPFDL